MGNNTGLVSPRYRHFIPVAPALDFSVSGLKRVGVSGGLVLVRAFGTTQETANQYVYQLDDQFLGTNTALVNVYIDGVFMANNYGFYGKSVPIYNQYGEPTYDQNGEQQFRTILEYDKFDYSPETNSIVLTSRATRPSVGAIIRVETVLGPATNTSMHIPMKKYLLQGADPVDGSISNPRDPKYQFFQGAYRCTLEVLNKPKHGVLTMADDQLGFVYRPEVGYYGEDKFMYRIINCMGQESPVACITLNVGTK